MGVHRLWPDLGDAIGALLAGVTAGAFGRIAAMWVVAAITLGSGVVVAFRMSETLRREPGAQKPEAPGRFKLSGASGASHEVVGNGSCAGAIRGPYHASTNREATHS